jgi:hypothetical protein
VVPEDWTTKIAFMRAHGVVRAEFTYDGHLIQAELGPQPIETSEQKQTQRPKTPEELVAVQREERRRRGLAAGSQIVTRVIGRQE